MYDQGFGPLIQENNDNDGEQRQGIIDTCSLDYHDGMFFLSFIRAEAIVPAPLARVYCTRFGAI